MKFFPKIVGAVQRSYLQTQNWLRSICDLQPRPQELAVISPEGLLLPVGFLILHISKRSPRRFLRTHHAENGRAETVSFSCNSEYVEMFFLWGRKGFIPFDLRLPKAAITPWFRFTCCQCHSLSSWRLSSTSAFVTGLLSLQLSGLCDEVLTNAWDDSNLRSANCSSRAAFGIETVFFFFCCCCWCGVVVLNICQDCGEGLLIPLRLSTSNMIVLKIYISA